MSGGRGVPPAGEPSHPRSVLDFHGHRGAEQALLEAYRAGRMPHAWLISGPKGIGKATLAYRMARFVLAHPDPRSAAVQAARSLAVEPDHPVVRRVAAQTEGSLLTLERTPDDKGKMRTVVTVDQVRETGLFFSRTATGGGWRMCVVDLAEELKSPEGANALLKILEEPPKRSLMLLVTHSPGRLLPTVRSRCRALMLRPLDAPAVAQAAAAALGRDPADPALVEAAAAADGSVARAIALCGGPLLDLRRRVITLLGCVPAADPRSLHALGDLIEQNDRAERDGLGLFVETVRDWLSAELKRAPQEAGRLAPLAEVWDRLDRAAEEVRTYNLDRRPLVFAVFGWLADAARG